MHIETAIANMRCCYRDCEHETHLYMFDSNTVFFYLSHALFEIVI